MNKHTRRLGIVVLIAETLLNMGMAAGMYSQYFMTDLIGMDVGTVSAILTVGSVIAVVFSIFGGALITNTKSRFGRYRPWLVATYGLMMIFIFLMMFHYGNAVTTMIVMSVSYAVFCGMSNIAATPKNGMYAAMGGGDSDARNEIIGKSFAGYNLAQMVLGFALLPLVHWIAGEGAEILGWRILHIILAALSVIGLVILLTVGRKFDPDNRHAEEEVQETSVKFGSMLKAVFQNRAAWTLFIADTLRFTGFMFLFQIMFYPVLSVIGDYFLMSLATVGVYLAQSLSGLVAPVLVEKLKGRKKVAILASLVTAGLYCLFCLTGKTYWGFLIIVTLANFTGGMIDAVDPLLYVDAGEYWLAKTGEDTRPFLLSMQAITASLSAVLAAPLFGAALTACHYDSYAADALLSASDATALTNWIGLGTAAAYILFAVFMFVHNVSDKDAEKYIQQNADAGLAMSEDMM